MGKLKELFLNTRIQQLDRDEMIEQQLNDEYSRCCEIYQAWSNGDKNPTNGTIQEYEFSKTITNN
tara:strand:+ start:891 stop:1085 length:195 start_codon:yes stop_codon:yes gene_type:complete